MQITQKVENNYLVVQQAKISELGHKQFSGDTALTYNGPNALNFWFITVFRETILRFVVDAETLETKRLVETKLKAADYVALSSTQRQDDNFISFPVVTSEGRRLTAYPIDQQGRIADKSWFLSPVLSSGCDEIHCKGGVASNGRVAFWADIKGREPASCLFSS